MTKYEDMLSLRNDPDIHYNCAQSVLIPFAEEIGMSRQQAQGLSAHFGGGMGCGSVCGAVTGALMAMGGLNMPPERHMELLEQIRQEYGSYNCADLVEGLEHGAPERKAKCDELVARCLSYVCELTGKE